MTENKNNLTCDGCKDMLERLVAGELAEPETEAMHRHLQSCPDCSAEAARSARMENELSEAFGLALLKPAEKEPASLSDLTTTAIREGTKLKRRSMVYRITGLAAAAALIICAVLFWPETPAPIEKPEDPIASGLHWLAANQEPDGHWDSLRHGAKTDFDLGLTGLATLALVTSDKTSADPALLAARDRGLVWLASKQRPDGRIEEAMNTGSMYGHAIATLALVEAYRNHAGIVKQSIVQRAVDYSVHAQLTAGGWSYRQGLEQSARPDTSHTGWFVLALASADKAGLSVPRASLARAAAWISSVTDPEGRVGYERPGEGTPATTAIGLMVMEQAPADETAESTTGATKVMEKLSTGDTGWKQEDRNLYFWHFLSRLQKTPNAKDKVESPRRLEERLLAQQKKNGSPLKGSWDNADPQGQLAGRVYSTALALVTLENAER